jgi:metal-responsive CopG/Arc/MetJ family transcriptional regulator
MGKPVLSVTIDEKVLSRWKNYNDKKCINSSKLIQKLIEDYLKKEDKNG